MKTADEINADQIAAAKKAGKEYQGRENEVAQPAKPSASADAPATGAEEVGDIDDVKAATVKK